MLTLAFLLLKLSLHNPHWEAVAANEEPIHLDCGQEYAKGKTELEFRIGIEIPNSKVAALSSGASSLLNQGISWFSGAAPAPTEDFDSALAKIDGAFREFKAREKEAMRPDRVLLCAEGCQLKYRPYEAVQIQAKSEISPEPCMQEGDIVYRKGFSADSGSSCKSLVSGAAREWFKNTLSGYGEEGEELWNQKCADPNCSYHPQLAQEFLQDPTGCRQNMILTVHCGRRRLGTQSEVAPSIEHRWVCE